MLFFTLCISQAVSAAVVAGFLLLLAAELVLGPSPAAD